LVELASRVPPAGQAGPRDHVMRGALGGPRVLLRRLREVMAEPVSAQERLDKIVVLIAANMVAEVCSVYVLRVDGTLELYATEGLNKAAVHQTVLRSDEGLVGLVASEANPVNLSDAQNHPAFSYRAETGEEIYHSFLGVPLGRGEVVDGGDHRDVLEAYRMFAYDRGWVHRLEEAVATGLTAEAAVERVQSDTRARMLRATDPYLRERLHDLDELANRLMHHLLGQDYAPARDRLPENAVLVARSMGPAALLEYDRKRLRGLVLEEGGPNSHVAIVARALGIAAVGEIANATGVADPGDAGRLDGANGDVHMRPSHRREAAQLDRVRL